MSRSVNDEDALEGVDGQTLLEDRPRPLARAEQRVTAAIASSLHAIAEEVTWEDVPGTDVYSCGNYRDHSLFSAREWSRTILEQGLSVDPFERVFIVH